MFFLDKIKKIVNFEKEMEENPDSDILLREAKRLGFSDSYIAELWKRSEDEIYRAQMRGEYLPDL